MPITDETIPKIEKYFNIRLNEYHKHISTTVKDYRINQAIFARCMAGGRSGKVFTFFLMKAFYDYENEKNINIDCITNEYAKETYRECLEFVKLLKEQAEVIKGR